MKNNTVPENRPCQTNSIKTPLPGQIPAKVANAALEVWNSCNQLTDMLWEIFSEDFIIIDEQMERKLPEIPVEDELLF